MASEMFSADDEEELFLAAIEIEDPQNRSRFISDSCAGNGELEQSVRELVLHYDGNPSFLEQPTAALSQCPKPGDTVDGFELLDVLGEGGFGIVYRAKQEQPIRREVAVKVLKVGMDTAGVVERFKQERQTLALLKHPQIAGVIDAGATDSGRPYFVMELVDGMPLDEFCDSQLLNIHQRCDILLQVCAAVQHAHQKGIIHRDLKPTNILVGGKEEGTAVKPQVKVIDFGIAKAITSSPSGVTQHGQMLGTPDYMSPEQRKQAADVDVRSDVYALGALLCKLLTGRAPEFHLANQGQESFQDSLVLPSSQMRQLDEKRLQDIALRRRETSKSLPRVYTGELDWITRKALAAKPDERYSSVGALAADLKAYLKNEPVAAGPPTWSYRAKKFVRRNQLASICILLLLLSILVGTGLTTAGFLQANRERQSAVAERDSSRETTKLMQRLLSLGNIQAGHKANFTVREMLDEFSNMLDNESRPSPSLRPEVEASVRKTLGRSYWSLGLMNRAGPHLIRTLELRKKHPGEEDIETAKSEIDFAKYLASTSQLTDAEHSIDRALPVLMSTDPCEELAWAHRVQAVVDREKGDFSSSLENSRKACEFSNQALGEDHPTTINLKIELVPILLDVQRFEEATRLSIDSLRHATRVDSESYNTASASRNRALVLEFEKNLPEAMRLIQNALRIDRNVAGEPSTAVVRDLIVFSRISRKLNRNLRAEEAARTACEYAEHITVEPAIIKPQAYDQLALIVRDEDPRQAIKLWQKGIDAKRESKLHHPIIGHFLDGQASCYRQLGEVDQAEEKYRECISVLDSISANDLRRHGLRAQKRPSHVADAAAYIPLTAKFNLATLLYEQQRMPELGSLFDDASLRTDADSDRGRLVTDLSCAAMHLASNNNDEAEALIDGVLNLEEMENQRPMLAWARVFKADLLVRRGEFKAARQLLERLQTFSQRPKFSNLSKPVQRLLDALPDQVR